MEEKIYTHAECDKSVNPTPRKNQTCPRSCESRFHGAVTLSLGLLSVFLLAGLFGLSVCCHVSVVAEFTTIKANLTESLQASEDKLFSVSAERDLLNATLTKKTKELDRLQCFSKQNKTCPSGWRMFNDSCYLLSSASGSWDTARQDCRDREADLVTIHSYEEQVFLSNHIKTYTWIGLHDRDNESNWKWVDGTPLTKAYWVRGWLDNGGGDPQKVGEDCAEIVRDYSSSANWNDVHCDRNTQWMCEKNART